MYTITKCECRVWQRVFLCCQTQNEPYVFVIVLDICLTYAILWTSPSLLTITQAGENAYGVTDSVTFLLKLKLNFFKEHFIPYSPYIQIDGKCNKLARCWADNEKTVGPKLIERKQCNGKLLLNCVHMNIWEIMIKTVNFSHNLHQAQISHITGITDPLSHTCSTYRLAALI